MNAPFPHEVSELAIAELKALLGHRASTGTSVLDLHAGDESHHDRHRPQIVVSPETTEEAAEIVKIAARYRMPITPFGAGSGLEGGAIPVRGGISLDTARLNRIIEIRADDMIARVGGRGSPSRSQPRAARYWPCSFRWIPVRMPPSAA